MRKTGSIRISTEVFLSICMKRDVTRYYDVTKDAIPRDAVVVGARMLESTNWKVVEVFFESDELEEDTKLLFTPEFTEVLCECST